MTNVTATTLKGHDAIEYAEGHGLLLCKAADPIEGAREGLTVAEAREIASEDPGLISVTVIMTKSTATVTVRANPDAEDCLADAVEAYIEEHPELAGYDLAPAWGDEDRETVTLTVPRWSVEVQS